MLAAAARCGAGFAAEATDRFFVSNLNTLPDFAGAVLAPAGSQIRGPNEAPNDRARSLDVAECLTVTAIAASRFDAKLQTRTRQTCIKRCVSLIRETTCDMRDADIADCRR